MFNIKKGAMFGLDARIALAIFGALSVISGAALYSAIQNAKTEQFRQGIIEVGKAIESYYLDNGKFLPQTGSVYTYTSDLLENRESLATWNGPYIEGTVYSPRIKMDFIEKSIGTGSYLDVLKLKGSDWSVTSDSTNGCVVNDVDCYAYIRIYKGPSQNTAAIQNLFLILDDQYDSGDGELVGRFRSCTNLDSVCFKYMPIQKQ